MQRKDPMVLNFNSGGYWSNKRFKFYLIFLIYFKSEIKYIKKSFFNNFSYIYLNVIKKKEKDIRIEKRISLFGIWKFKRTSKELLFIFEYGKYKVKSY